MRSLEKKSQRQVRFGQSKAAFNASRAALVGRARHFNPSTKAGSPHRFIRYWRRTDDHRRPQIKALNRLNAFHLTNEMQRGRLFLQLTVSQDCAACSKL